MLWNMSISPFWMHITNQWYFSCCHSTILYNCYNTYIGYKHRLQTYAPYIGTIWLVFQFQYLFVFPLFPTRYLSRFGSFIVTFSLCHGFVYQEPHYIADIIHVHTTHPLDESCTLYITENLVDTHMWVCGWCSCTTDCLVFYVI